MIPVSDVILAVCQWLDDEDLADYKTDVPYADSDRAVTVKRLPAKPDSAVSVTLYGKDDATLLPDTTVRVQLRFRAPVGSRTSVDDWADAVAAKLHWKHNIDLAGLMVSRSRRTLVAPTGADDNGREERADSYELILLTT